MHNLVVLLFRGTLSDQRNEPVGISIGNSELHTSSTFTRGAERRQTFRRASFVLFLRQSQKQAARAAQEANSSTPSCTHTRHLGQLQAHEVQQREVLSPAPGEEEPCAPVQVVVDWMEVRFAEKYLDHYVQFWALGKGHTDE